VSQSKASGAEGDVGRTGAPPPPPTDYRSRLIGPAFAVAVLMTPSVIALFRAGTQAWLNNQSNPWLAALVTVQYGLLTIGLSAGVAACAMALYHRPVVRRLLHLFLFCGLLELFYQFAYGGPVSPGILLSVPETSQRETGELLAGHAILTGSLTLVALLTIYTLVVSWRARIRFPVQRCIQLGGVAVCMIGVSLAIGGRQFGNARSLESAIVSEVQSTFPFDVANAFGEVAIGLIDTRRLAATRARFRFTSVSLVDAAGRAGASEIYVIVIGETSRRLNWSLFGYPRDTTPRLDEIKDDLILFQHVTSNATNTILSVPLALTRAAPATRRVARSEKSIITLLKQAGYETFWISNQERSDVLSNPISQIALEADHVSFPADVKPDDPAGRFDSNLLTRLDDGLALLPRDRKAVIFLHMEGSHFGYRERYPASFARFRNGQTEPRTLHERQVRLVDEYDNSVSFTDHVVRGVIDRLALCACKAGLLYFSDHGERLFDNGLTDSDFGHGFPTVSRPEIEIPFFLWLPPAYRQANPSGVARLRANAQSAAQLHNLFETIIDLTGVDYENRSGSLSLFSDQFQPPQELDVLNTDEETVSLPVEPSEPVIARSTL
jgi:glucan phosphoethanolaminetransferase (alkaline phosphatase superfamily)